VDNARDRTVGLGEDHHGKARIIIRTEVDLKQRRSSGIFLEVDLSLGTKEVSDEAGARNIGQQKGKHMKKIPERLAVLLFQNECRMSKTRITSLLCGSCLLEVEMNHSIIEISLCNP